MKVKINHSFMYEVEHLVKTFTPSMVFVDDQEELLNLIEPIGEKIKVKASCGKYYHEEVVENQTRQIKRGNSRVIYDVLSKHFNHQNPYGTLVGVRPVKLVHEMLEHGLSDQEILDTLYNNHRVSKEKRSLLLEIGKREAPFLKDKMDQKYLSLYICIPFCPTRCLYCSFPSNDLRKKKNIVAPYLDALVKSIEAAYKDIVEHDKIVDCIYIGGGTPSVLSKDQFKRLLDLLDEYFNLKTLKEFTIEAGRPDTIDADKLKVFKEHHVSRICINPQSMNEKTLSLIGRDHHGVGITECYEMAKSYEFNSVNMDVILGLPDEDLDDVKHTMEAIIDLSPENITVHTLAVKTSSRLKEKLEEYKMTQAELVEAMLAYTDQTLRAAGYVPYYMYRQKNMVGNFENVGYCKPGFESLYNIRIIEEQHNILALGAGAVSKRCFPNEDRFQRIANIKGVETYIERIDDVIKKSSTFFNI